MNPFYLVLNPDNTISFNRPLAHAIGLSETIIYGGAGRQMVLLFRA